MRRTLNTATLLLSFEVLPVLNSYLSKDRSAEDLVVEVERDILASGVCMARLIQIARRDLGMRPLELERLPEESTVHYWKRRVRMFFARDRASGT